MALEEHLHDAVGAAEVAVDLEGRVGVEEIRIRALGGEEEGEELVGAFAVEEAGPAVDLPAEAPAGGGVAANFQGAAGGGGELGGEQRGDLGGGVEGVEVGDVAVVALGGLHVPVLKPFLELAGFADLVRRQAVAGGGDSGAEVDVEAELSGSFDTSGEEIAQDLVIHRGAGGDGTAEGVGVFGGVGRVGDEPALGRVFLEGGKEELGGAFEQGVGAGEVVAVAGEAPGVVVLDGEPGAAEGPHAPEGAVDGGGAAPEVEVVVGDPAGGAIHLLGGAGSALGGFGDEAVEGLGALGEVAGEGRPVVHLDIDVDGVFRAPGRGGFFVPNALEVGGLGAGAGGGEEEVASELGVEGGEGGISSGGVGGDAGVGGECGGGTGGGGVFAEGEAHAAEEGLVIGEVGGEEGGVVLAATVGEVGVGAFLRIGGGVVPGDVAGGGDEEEGDGIRVADGDAGVAGHGAAALGEDFEAGEESEGTVTGGVGAVAAGEGEAAGVGLEADFFLLGGEAGGDVDHAGAVGGEADDEGLGGGADEVFAGVAHAVDDVGDAGDGGV